MVKNAGSGTGLLGVSSWLHCSPRKVCDFRQVAHHSGSYVTELLLWWATCLRHRGLDETVRARCLALHPVHSRCLKMWGEEEEETKTAMMMVALGQPAVLVSRLCVLGKRRWRLYYHKIQTNSEVDFLFFIKFLLLRLLLRGYLMFKALLGFSNIAPLS